MCPRDTVRKPLEERKRSLEESLYSNNPDALEMLQKLREAQQEEQFILSEIMKRYISKVHFTLVLPFETNFLRNISKDRLKMQS